MLVSCQRDAYLTRAPLTILAIEPDEGGASALVSDSVLYPEGGGQPSDTGLLRSSGREVRVLSVAPAKEGARMRLDGVLPLGPAEAIVDWERRYDHMQQHTAQHLLTAIAADRFGWSTTSFHLHEGPLALCDIELDASVLPPERLAALGEQVNAEVRAARPVTVRETTRESLPPGLRSRGLPDDHDGPVRLVEIEGLDVNTCGGTHVRSTAELQGIALLHVEKLRGGSRLHFVAGGRLFRRLARAEEQRTALSSLLSRSADEAAEGVAALLEEAKAAKRQLKLAQEELADHIGASLAGLDEPVLHTHRDEPDLVLLNRVASAALRIRPEATLWLTAGGGPEGLFLLAAPKARVEALKAPLLSMLEAKGGGPAGRLQGKTALLSRSAEVIALIRSVS